MKDYKQKLKEFTHLGYTVMKDYKQKLKEFTHLGYTGLLGGLPLEHLKIETRLINEKIANALGVCDLDVIGAPSKLSQELREGR